MRYSNSGDNTKQPSSKSGSSFTSVSSVSSSLGVPCNYNNNGQRVSVSRYHMNQRLYYSSNIRRYSKDSKDKKDKKDKKLSGTEKWIDYFKKLTYADIKKMGKKIINNYVYRYIKISTLFIFYDSSFYGICITVCIEIIPLIVTFYF